MLKVKTGTSVNPNAKAAGKEAAAQVKDNLKDMKMAFVYSGVQYDQKEFLAGIAEELPGVPLIGNTSFTGIITQDGYISSEDGFGGIMALSDPDLTVGVYGMPKEGTARETGHKVAVKAMEDAGKDCAPDYFYMSAPSGEEEYYLKGITEVIGRVPFFGGSAADNTITGEWLIYTDSMVAPEGVSVAFFYTDKAFANKFTGAYHETANAGIITKIDGDRTLVEINGKKAIDQYREWTGASAEDVAGGNLLSYAICKPLGVKDRLGDLVAIRHPMNGNEDGSMAIGNNLAVNTAVVQMEASVDELIESVGAALEELKKKINGPIAGLHLVHCGGRRAGIDSRIDEVAQQVKKAVGDIPFIVEFTFGEYGYEDDGNNTCGGLMLSFTAFGE
ncbi:MAG TPA: FIST C-terminal domain-containing protein [Candidatus Copromorpha excrementigallinarum]|uniref:FIST C-terminal domain-containing protein n=1 Tax=Candidatus Allocopromorpha excrementigallinarum TaxID=2840742 RepID=A0A9D1I4E2_9FIRM|nr:FIST C-terminal domain-containing protein [Candidatus Copromorpha excrementigallinarum]